jgi:hypothetical protein
MSDRPSGQLTALSPRFPNCLITPGSSTWRRIGRTESPQMPSSDAFVAAQRCTRDQRRCHLAGNCELTPRLSRYRSHPSNEVTNTKPGQSMLSSRCPFASITREVPHLLCDSHGPDHQGFRRAVRQLRHEQPISIVAPTDHDLAFPDRFDFGRNRRGDIGTPLFAPRISHARTDDGPFGDRSLRDQPR